MIKTDQQQRQNIHSHSPLGSTKEGCGTCLPGLINSSRSRILKRLGITSTLRKQTSFEKQWANKKGVVERVTMLSPSSFINTQEAPATFKVARCSHQKEYNNRTKITPYTPMKWYNKTFLLLSWALCTGFSQLIEKAVVHLIKRNRRKWCEPLHYPTRFNIKQIFNIFTRRGL